MTEAEFTTFVKNQLRAATRKWLPIVQTLKDARVDRGWYKCNVCKDVVPVSILKNGKRVKGVQVDHISPIVDPQVGFTTWDEFINRLFSERDNLQLICSPCHDVKSKAEATVARERRRKKNNEREV